VSDQLREQLVSGRWPVGTRIPGEQDLAVLWTDLGHHGRLHHHGGLTTRMPAGY
jgi:hypothetical protein